MEGVAVVFDLRGVQGGGLDLDEDTSLGYFRWYRRILFLYEGPGRIAPPDDFPDGLNRG